MSSTTLESTLDRLEKTAHDDGDHDDRVSVGDLVQGFGRRSFGAVIAVAAFIALIPIVGGIPGVSIVTGAIILAAAVQMVMGRDHLWLPGFIEKRRIAADTLSGGLERTRGWVRWLDRHTGDRMSRFVAGPVASTVAATVTAVLAILFFPTALIPWGVSLPALAAMMLGLALIRQDGVLAIAAYVVTGASVFLVLYFF